MESGQQESDTQEGLAVFRLWSGRTKKGRDHWSRPILVPK